MEVEAARNVFHPLSGTKNQVCRYWLEGRCKMKPCRFMHKESPPPQTRKLTWRNPNSNTGKSGPTEQEIDIASKIVVRAGLEKITVGKEQPKQCKYWVTGNCVYGDKCKNLHSWFCGSGFAMLAKLEGHKKAITGISLPSGFDKLCSGGKDGTVKVWDCNSGQCAGSIVVDGEVGCLVTEGPWLFVGLQNAVKAWNVQTNVEFGLDARAGLVFCMVVDNGMLIAGMEDGTILVWKWHPETKILEPAAMLKEHNGAVCSLVVGFTRLYSGSRDCTIKVWDLQNLQCLHTLCGHTKDVTSVICWDSYLLSASLDNTIKVWSATESGTIEVTYESKETTLNWGDCSVWHTRCRSSAYFALLV